MTASSTSPPAFRNVTSADWRALVEKELAGAPFDKALVQRTAEGLAIEPLYTEDLAVAVDRRVPASPFLICTRHAKADAVAIREDLEGGVEALWLPANAPLDSIASAAKARTGTDARAPYFVIDVSAQKSEAEVEPAIAYLRAQQTPAFALALDPIGEAARGSVSKDSVTNALATAAKSAASIAAEFPDATTMMVATSDYHAAGAESVLELAIALSTGARTLEALLDAGIPVDRAAKTIAVQLAAGRDTFVELAKFRALRVVWSKLLGAYGVMSSPRLLVHGVAATRTLSARDPWVNMLRTSTQLFAAILGGADLVTPRTFDEALTTQSALGRRVARNTGLVLREESFLGKVSDPAGGSYYFEAVTDSLARAAWARFQKLEAEGGIIAALENGSIEKEIAASWKARLGDLRKRKVAVLGVSEFANLGETLPAAPLPQHANEVPGLTPHRDAEPFEALRDHASEIPNGEVVLLTLGTLAETRPRAGFASTFFSAGGLRSRETDADEKAAIVCLCGTDDAYREHGPARARALKALGVPRVLVAGRPGAIESELREAGVDGFIFVGCDATTILDELLDGLSESAPTLRRGS